MENIEGQVRRVRRRLLVQSFAGKLGRTWFVALGAAAVAIGVGKWWPLVDETTWTVVWVAGSLVAATLAALAWTWAGRHDALAAAVEIDHRLGLKERVSSSLALAPQERASAMGRALVRDAESRLARENVLGRFRLRLDRWAALPLVPAVVVFALAAFVPLRTPQAPAKPATAQAATTRASTRKLAEGIQAQRKEAAERGLQDLDPLLARLEHGVNDLAKADDNDRKKTLVALNDLVKEAQKRRFELSASADLKKQLAGLEQLRQGPAEKFAQAIKNGDLDKAVEGLEKLRQDLAGGKLDPQAQKALAEQLDQLQRALAEQAKAHEQKMRDLANQIEAQQRAGNQARAEQLREQRDKLAAERQQMEQLAAMREELAEAAECVGGGKCEQAAQALNRLEAQIRGIQEDMQQMEMLDGALEQVAGCKRAMACQNCQGLGCEACQGGNWEKSFGQHDRFAKRDGGKGIGMGEGGGLGPETDPKGKFYDSRVRQQPGRGAAAVVGEADGPNRKGLVQEEIQDAFAGGAQDAADALGERRLPRDYREHAQTYFDALREGAR